MPIHTHIENEIAEIIFDFPPVNALPNLANPHDSAV